MRKQCIQSSRDCHGQQRVGHEGAKRLTRTGAGPFPTQGARGWCQLHAGCWWAWSAGAARYRPVAFKLRFIRPGNPGRLPARASVSTPPFTLPFLRKFQVAEVFSAHC